LCGIIAIVSKSALLPESVTSKFDSLVDLMSHRGPDGRGVHCESQVCLGHRRLAIIDLSSGGDQPMKSYDGRFVIVFNGEIYNYIELRKELEKSGVAFHTGSDTEVLLNLLAREGPAALSKLNGMFALALWDSTDKSLFVARDRYGVKPVYYIETDEVTAFSSEIKPLLELLPSVEPNETAVYDFLQASRVDHSDETFFARVMRLPSGFYATVSGNQVKLERWYDIDREVAKVRNESAFAKRTRADHVRTLKDLFRSAVVLRLRSDVPVGSCLSGGIDSSSIVTTATSLLDKDSLHMFETYSAVYGPWFKQDETRYIEAVIDQCGIKGNFVTPTAKDLDEVFDEFLYHQEEPVTTTSVFSGYCVMKLAHSKHAKVLLDGQGADEILAGYDYMVGYYLAELLRRGRLWRFLKEAMAQVRRKNRIGLAKGFAPFVAKTRRRTNLKANPLLSRDFAQRFHDRQVVEPKLVNPQTLNRGLIDHVTSNFQHLLRWEDRNSMAFSVETRLPFLDYRLVAYVLALPPEMKIRNGTTKWILREAMADLLPKIIAKRTDKIGFATPELHWFRNCQLKLFEDLRQRSHPLLDRYVNRQLMSQLLSSEPSDIPSSVWSSLFRVACLDRWLGLFFKDQQAA